VTQAGSPDNNSIGASLNSPKLGQDARQFYWRDEWPGVIRGQSPLILAVEDAPQLCCGVIH